MIVNPIIGIGGALKIRTEIPFIGIECDFNNNSYSKAIYKGGGTPIYFPVVNDSKVIRQQIRICDGLILAGGSDINPIYYGKEPLPLLENTFTEVDEYQMTLTEYALEKNIPILGVCKGMQMLNIVAGGTLYQDLSYANPDHIKHRQDSQLNQYCHSISIKPDSIIYKFFGDNILVNSWHHQSIEELGKDIKVTAISPDRIIESIEMTNKKFVVGVQWHPEVLIEENEHMLPLFKNLINSSINNSK